MRRSVTAVLVALVLGLVVVLSSVFVVDEREKALVLQFGQIRQVREEPGLGFKIPLIQEVVKYDDRILSLDTETIEVTPSDDRRLVVDAFSRYRIEDVVRFRQAVGAGGIATAQDRLGGILNTTVREVLGAEGVTSDTILSAERGQLMTRIRDVAQGEAQNLGLSIVDVRLKTTNLPAQNLDATFARMRAEREREAADERARGGEAAQRVRAQADRTRVETLSEAERDAQVTRGEADAEANRVFAEAFGADPEFFEFYRSMQAYEQALRGSNSTMVLTPDNAFFDYLYGYAAEGPDRAGSRSDGAPAGAAAVTEPPAGAAVEPATEAEPAEDAPATVPADEGATVTLEAAEAAPEAGPATGEAGAAVAAAPEAGAAAETAAP